jgi:sugar phosphate isomerase/epimerase
MGPRFSVLENTTPHLTFAEDVSVFGKVGAEGIGIIENKISDYDLSLRLVQASGLEVSSFFPACSSILPEQPGEQPADPESRIQLLCDSIRRMRPFSPSSCFISTGPAGSYTPAQAYEIVVSGIRRASAVAAECEMRLALELLHPSLSSIFGFVNSIPAGIELMEAVDHPNFGLTIDAWHLGSPPTLLTDIRQNAASIIAIHVNDRRSPTRSWCDRVLPGDGIADLPGIFASLKDGGFEGWYELEVLSDDGSVENDFADSLWKLPPQEMVKDGRAKFLAAWEASS